MNAYEYAFIEASRQNDIVLVKSILNSILKEKSFSIFARESSFVLACGDDKYINLLKLLLDLDSNSDPKLNFKEFTQKGLHEACKHCNIEAIELLYTKYNINIDEKAFELACSGSSSVFMNDPKTLKTVMFLLDPKFNVDIHAGNEKAFKTACSNGKIEIVKFLLRPEYNIDYHNNNDEACYNAFEKQHKDILELLLNEPYNVDFMKMVGDISCLSDYDSEVFFMTSYYYKYNTKEIYKNTINKIYEDLKESNYEHADALYNKFKNVSFNTKAEDKHEEWSRKNKLRLELKEQKEQDIKN